jgi:hypothetical protein
VIVPAAAVPPCTPFTRQVTAVLEAFVTVAAKACVFPRITDPELGVTVTVICGGGGGAVVVPLLCEQPHMPAPTAIATNSATISEAKADVDRSVGKTVAEVAKFVSARGRMSV